MVYVVAVLLLCALILFHELGHFTAAKAFKIKVNEFALGLGPTIASFGKGETKFSIKLLPLGGACMMEGEDEDSDNPRSFQKASVWARLIVVAAGPIFNFILAYFLALVILFSLGSVQPVVSYVVDGYPAQEAGIEAGDRIVKMDSSNIHFFKEISLYSAFHSGETVEITYERDGQLYKTSLTPVYDEEYGSYLYGVGQGGYEKSGFFRTLANGFYEVGYWIKATVGSLKLLLTGEYGINDLSGPVGIVKYVGDTVSESSVDGMFYVVMNICNLGILISANLGVMNLLPLPALDGGRIVFFIIEIIRHGKRIPAEKEGMVHFVGIICLFALMFYVIFQDIFKISTGQL